MSHTSRRRFAQSLAAATAMMPLSVLAETTAPPPPAVAKALTELTRAQYGKHLDAGELAQIEKDFADAAPLLERLRSFKLANGDAPDFL
jgi:hypothetical protein